MNDYAKEAAKSIQVQFEQHLRVVIRPKPKWLPMWIWSRLLRRLVVVEMTQPTMRVVT